MNADGGLGLALCVGAVRQLLEPALVRLGQLVLGERKLRLEPLGASDAVVAAETREVLGGLGGLEAVQMGGRQEVVGDLVNVPKEADVRRRRRGGRRLKSVVPYLVFRRVFVRVFLFAVPILSDF